MTKAEKQAKLDEIAKPILDRSLELEIAKSCLNPVPGEGNPAAEIMFVGEAPGAEEDKQSRPFVGASGKFLESMLETIDRSRQDVFITNIVKFRPPNNRDPSREEIQACLPYLLAQIKVIDPKLIVFLGRHSMNVFFPELRISQAHGQPVKRSGRVFLPLYHPAAALYNGSMRAILQEDFGRIPAILRKVEQQS
ncbi:uracil-DNA glycosylase [Candidatus Saccharibacteria bacterium]|nr:uracil-DNA glycosylase [Candidatus Saccharibacteria bacterium]